MMHSLRTSLFYALLSLSIASACETSQVGVTNRFGSIEAKLATTPNRATAAAEEVLREMELRMGEVMSTAIDGRVEAQTANDDQVVIRTKAGGPDVTEISIRVGSGMGDEALSLEILDRIRAKL